MKQNLKSMFNCALPFRFSLAVCVLAFLVGSAARISANRLNAALDSSTEAVGQPIYPLKAQRASTVAPQPGDSGGCKTNTDSQFSL